MTAAPGDGTTPIRLLLADDQAMVRGALAALLDLETDLRVVGQVGRGDEVLDAVREVRPDVCLLDIEMPGLDGIEVAALLAQEAPEVRTMIVTTFGRPGYVRRALDAGASGFLVKDAPATELADAVRRIHAGLRVVDPALATESLFGGDSPLTARECDVLRFALTGRRAPAIAAELFLSPGTVRNHLSSAIAKTGTDTAVAAAREARRCGWI
ncbi:response regulator transcription factor [Mobilicoccus pelagius]|uniref:Putative two-component response regulator n=1 Tax=Mobilicoccus pelagius NBRC 104925 TaxID=1089455 RepID=H5UNK8_9MICO|nr:response regulator transcription factor [Mobilicoccus pelagius]GAB47316.1 putative two-component response regulator [Mobilicoccus pelagius NBRC 104925]